MAVRRIVVDSLSNGGEEIEQTTFEMNEQRIPLNNESVPMSHDTIMNQSNDEHLLSRKYSLLSMQYHEDTWLELELTADGEETKTDNIPVMGPKLFQNNYEKALFFKGDSHWKKLRSIVMFGFVIVLVILYVYLDMDVVYFGGQMIDIFACTIPLLISLYFFTNIREINGKPGKALRVFSLLKESDRSLLKKRHFYNITLVLSFNIVRTIILFIYIFIRWEMIPLWGQIIMITMFACLFIPHFTIFMLFALFGYVADTTERLLGRQKIFVYNQSSLTLDWVVVQKNFDICESIIDEISKGFQWVFVGALLVVVSTTSYVIGIISQYSSWHAAGYQPFSIVLLLVSEIMACIANLVMMITIWSAASQITAACDGVLVQCTHVLAFLRMSPSFKISTDEYLRAQLFHTYVKEANLGFKVFGVRISYALATSIVVPFISVLSVVGPIIYKSF